MKLLVSDYDGTLKQCYINNNLFQMNIDAINKFRNKGHKFMISTGRCYVSIKRDIDKYNISYDYLSCNDGAILFDNKNNIINSSYIYPHVVKDVIRNLKNNMSTNNFKLYNPYGVGKGINNIVEIGVFSNPLLALREKKIILDIISSHKNISLLSVPGIYFIENSGGKCRTIDIVSKMENFSDIITIGDNKNDQEMLLRYNGYKVISAMPFLYFKNIKTENTIKDLIKKII